VPGGSEIHFYIDYAFASRMLAVLMGAVFDKAVRRYTEAFEERARAVYGTPSANTTTA
jgi:coenzyme Q-binding protein COQ10